MSEGCRERTSPLLCWIRRCAKRGMHTKLPLLAGYLAVSATLAGESVRVGPAAFGDWREDAPGVRRLITPADLPSPFATPSAANPPREEARTISETPIAPLGFTVDLYVSGLAAPRVARVAPNGDVFVAESRAGAVRVLQPSSDGGPPTRSAIFAEGLERPFGIAFYPSGDDPSWVYVATTGSVVRFPYRSGELKPQGEAEVVVPNLPAGGSHWTRDIAFSPDDKTMFVSVGSATNDAEVPAAWDGERNRADVLAFDPEGRNKRVFASGVRNCSGMTIEPATGALWCVVNERDGLGDNLPPDYATRVVTGAFYGWPWYYIGDHHDPRHRGERPELAAKVVAPDVLFQPHSAPLGIVFYERAQFPPEYRGDAFVAFHGSWNRSRLTGYKVVRVIMKGGKPTGVYEDFLTGFVAGDGRVWGRPVDVAATKDGALLVTDDAGGVIRRVRWKG